LAEKFLEQIIMRERFVDIVTPDGPMDTFITHPEQGGPFPPVVIFMDIWGIREELFDVARRVGTVGYYCLVPNFYHRVGKVHFDFRDEKGRTFSFDRLDKTSQAQVARTFEGLSNEMVMRDTGALIDFIRTDGFARVGAMGSIGYCMGGRHALCAAGHFPDNFVATVSLHGTLMISERDDSPHLLASKFHGEMYCGFGSKDTHTPPALVAQMANLLAQSSVTYNYLVHDGVIHGYTLPDRDVFDKHAANRDWERIFNMFRRQLSSDR
jgi:carboxymethylenebutenolidase